MTAAADTNQHPDISEISDLTEGLLPPSRTAAVRHHLDGCVQCSDAHASLEEIRALLGAVPGTQQMPADVVGRIDAALAAEVLPGTMTSLDAGSVSRETERTLDETTRVDRPSGRPRGATGPGRNPARRRRRTTILGAAFGAAVVGMSVFLLQPAQTSQDSASQVADRQFGVAEDSEQTFSEGTLGGRVNSLLSAAEADRPPSTDATAPSVDTKSSPDGLPPGNESPRTPLRTPVLPVPPCVQQGTGRETPALALEEGRYQGVSAFLVVLPHATDSSRVQAYVVDASCVGTAPESKGRLLLAQDYDRP